LDQTNDRVRALEAGADDYMTKPVDRVELVARVRSALRLKGVYDSLDSAEHVIFALAAAVEAKDPYTEAHTQRVADAARAIGSRMNLPLSDLDALYRGGLIHDIGKIGIPDAILLKPGPLDPRELAIMQQHPMMGENIVAPLRSGASLLPIIRHHHERFDGTGYPDRLSGAGIPRLARGCAVCDALDSRVSERLWPAGFARCAYALLRYRDSLIPPPRRWHVAAVASLAAASVTLLAAQAVTANRAVVLAIAVAWILVWCVCVGEPIVRFWLVARRLPAVQGWRLRSLSLGFGGLVLGLLLAISIGGFVRQVGSLHDGVSRINIDDVETSVIKLPARGLTAPGTLIILAGRFTPAFGNDEMTRAQQILSAFVTALDRRHLIVQLEQSNKALQ